MQLKILFIDDERGLCEQAKIFLEKENDRFEVETAISAEEGLELFEEKEYDVIVSDYQMPDMDGLELLKEIKQGHENAIPFIMFTGKGREEIAMKALNLGADRYLQKGGTPRSQYAVLADAIDQEYEHYQSEKKYRTVVENTHDAIYIYRDNEFLFVNKRFTEITGYSEDELLEMEMTDLLQDDEKEKIREIGKKRADSEKAPSKYETKIVTKDGEIKHLQLTISSIEHIGKKAFLVSARDITEDVQKEREIRKSKNWLSQIVDRSSVPMFVIDKDHRVTHWNTACERLTGISKEEIKGTKDPWKAFYQEERPVMADLVLENADEERISEYYENKFERSSLIDEGYEAEDFFPDFGEKGKYVFFTAAPIKDSEDRRIGAIETLQDVSERRRVQNRLKDEHERLQTLIHNIPGITYRCIKDKHWTMKFLSEGVEKLTGYEADEMLENKKIAYNEIIHPEDRDHVRREVEKGLENDAPYKVEYRIITASGDERWVWERGRAVGYQDGDEVLEGAIIDITDKKETEERHEFLDSIIRHDVQNKLQLAKGYVELLKEEIDKDVEYTWKIFRTIRNAEEIVKKVRTLDKIENEDEEQEMELSGIFDRIMSEHGAQADENDIEIELEEVEKKVKGGPLLYNLFSNLMENAIKHSGGDKIRISAEENGDYRVIIEDDGQGITDEEKDKIMKRGYKRGNSAGSGLGLYLVKEIVENYGGDIRVRDSDMGGARFDIKLQTYG